MSLPILLIVEDNHALAIALAAAAGNCGLSPLMAPTLAIARKILDKNRVEGILLDIGLPDGHGLELIEQWKTEWTQGGAANGGHKPNIAVISAHGEIENAIAARKLGIAHFFDKPVDFEALQEFFKSIQPAPPSDTSKTLTLTTSFIGSSPVMRPVVHQISHTCISDQPVVISGGPGTGKTYVANIIQQSAHRNEPQKINAENSTTSNDTPNLLQASALLRSSQLIKQIESSKNNSLIIESIHSMPMDLQELLAQMLDELEKQAPRLIVTTDEDGLTHRFRQGDFNRDLYFRLQVLEIKLPPLASRLEDLRAIITCFLKESASSDSTRPDHFTLVDDSVFSALQKYSWPGNLRELRNAINHAVVTAAESPLVSVQHLPSYITEPSSPRKISESDFATALESWVNQELSSEINGKQKYKQLTSKLERALLQILLTRFENKPSRLAAELSINRSTLRKKLNSPM